MADLTKEQRTALWQTRIIWAALLLGQIMAGAVLVGIRLVQGQGLASAGGAGWVFALVPAVMLLTLTPIGYFIRNQFYKAKWQGDVVAPAGYVNGNILLLSMLEGTGLTAWVMMLITDQPVWPALAAVLAMAVQAINFPTGEPMRPHRPDFVR